MKVRHKGDKAIPPATPAELSRARHRLAAIGSMASIVTHQARNRLATLRAALELLADGLEGHLSREYRATLLRELDDFVGEFNLGADMVRCDFGAPGPFSVSDEMEEIANAFRPYADREGLALECAYAHTFESICADRRLLRLALLNLMRNSAQALRGNQAGRIILRTGNDSRFIHFDVEDNGPGVPPRHYPRFLLEPAPEDNAAGLGLVVCRDAMLLMRGSIGYLTQPGEAGARFRLSLPVKQ
jgi:signal transduction histidine kinase